MWHRQGKINVTKGSDVVTGTNTGWVENIRVGDAFQGPDGKLYQVINVASNEALAISPAYEGNSATGLNYWIVPIPGYNKVQADRLSLIISKLDGDIVNATEAAEQAVSAAQQAQQWRNEAVNSAAAALASEQHAESLVDDALSSKQAAELAAARSEAARDQSETAADGIRGVFDSVSLKAGEAADSAANAENSAAAAALSESKAKTSELAAQGASANAQSDAASAQASKNLAAISAQEAAQARDDAVAVTTGGDATLDPGPGKIPLARATGVIDQGWVHGLEHELDQLRMLRNQIKYGDGPYPVLDFQFAGARYLDPRIQFTRASLDWDSEGEEYEINEPVITDEGLWASRTRTNLIPNPENIDLWNKQQCAVSRVGSWFEVIRTELTAEARPRVNGIIVKPGTVYTLHVDAKESMSRYIRVFSSVRLEGRAAYPYANFDLQTGEVTQMADAGVLDVDAYSEPLEGGGFRCFFACNSMDSTSRNIYFNVINGPTGSGAGDPIGSSIFIRHPQLEERDPTPYIPAEGSQVTVTASTAVAQKGLESSSWTVFSEVDVKNKLGLHQSIFSIYESGQHRIRLLLEADGNLAVVANAPGQPSFAVRTPFAGSETTKVAVSYDGNSLTFYYNGVPLTGLIDGLSLSGLPIQLGSYNNSAFLDGYIKVFNVYDHALSHVQLQELTS